MSGSKFAIVILILAAIAAVMLMWRPLRRPRVYEIDSIDLIRLRDARQAPVKGRPMWARWVILAIALAFLVWGLFG